MFRLVPDFDPLDRSGDGVVTPKTRQIPAVFRRKKKGRGPRPIGTDPFAGVRLPQKVLDQVDAMAERNRATRSETLRTLILRGLESSPDVHADAHRAHRRSH